MFSLAALAILAAGVWLAPRVVVLTRLRDRPLEAVFAGIDGSVSSAAATWGWLDGIEYRDILLRDRAGRALVAVPRLVLDRGLMALAWNPHDLGTVRLVGTEAVIDVRAGGSSLEDVLAPWLATLTGASPIRPPACALEVVDARIEFRDLVRGDAWRISDVYAAGTMPSGPAAEWIVAGRIRQVGGGASAASAPPPADPTAEPGLSDGRLDRATVAAHATAAVARDGGFSLAAPAGDPDARTVTLATNRLPLGCSAVLATRFGGGHVVDGLASVRLDATCAAAATRLVGTLSAERLAVCQSASLAEILTVDRCELPLDCTITAGDLVVRKFAFDSGIVRAAAHGRLRLPHGSAWSWGESLIDDDFSATVAIDLAAASRNLAAGLAVRPDVRITDGKLELAAASRADGGDRVLEVRIAARDLAAQRSVAGPEGDGVQRPLHWPEPLTAFVRGRRPHGRGLWIEDARLVSPAAEISATGDAATATIQGTLDITAVAAELAEVLDLGGLVLGGTARGRIDVTREDAAAAARVKVAASVADFSLSAPGRPDWKDAEITLAGDATGRIAAGAAFVDEAHAVLAAGADRLEATLTGGLVVGLDTPAAAGVRLRPAADRETIAADCSLTGELARWQARVAGVWPKAAHCGAWSGTVKAAAAVASSGPVWQITRAGAEVEKLTVLLADRRIFEPRVVATAAGLVDTARGRIEVSSGELLTATVSVRTGGLAWATTPDQDADGLRGVLARLRGRAQWRAQAGRLERWLLPAETVDRWPVGGELSGTLDLTEAAAGANLLLEATASQLSIGRPPAAGRSGGPPQPVWHEPRARLVLDLTQPPAGAGFDGVRIDRLSLESSTLAVSARGDVQDWSARRLLELDGTAAYDWEQVSRLLTPWTGGRLRIAGAGTRPFALRSPLSRPPAIEPPAPAPATVSVPLPDEWFAAARGGSPAADHAARVARPVKATRAEGRRLEALASGLAIDTTAAWTAAEIDGFTIGGGEMPLRLFEGQLACGPFEVAAGGGRLRGAPWVRFTPSAELIVPQGRVVERVTLSAPLCEHWVGWLSPLVGHATHARGVVSVDTSGCRLPLSDPFTGEAAAQVVFDEFEVTPAGSLQPLRTLLARLQAVVDPRFAFGDKVVLLRVRPEPITVRLAEGRLWHEGLVMDAGQIVVRSRGSVAADGTLAMVVEVALRGDIAGQTPVVAQLLRTPLAIPLAGTVHQPQFDARAIDLVLGRIVENTAQAVIQDGMVRGLESLETLFGNPPPATPPQSPAATPPPLTFPGRR